MISNYEGFTVDDQSIGKALEEYKKGPRGPNDDVCLELIRDSSNQSITLKAKHTIEMGFLEKTNYNLFSSKFKEVISFLQSTHYDIKDEALIKKLTNSIELYNNRCWLEKSKINTDLFKTTLSKSNIPPHTTTSKKALPVQPEKKLPLPLPPPTPYFSDIDEKIFAHIQGSAFVQNTGYEGGQALRNMEFLLPFLKANQYFKDQENVVSLIESAIQTEKRAPQFRNNHQEYAKNIETYSNELSKKIASLRPGEKALIPGGWSNVGHGHAIIYLIERTSDDQFALTVVNTGSGLEYHEAHHHNLKEKSNAIYRIKEIDKEKITNPIFFKSLLELKVTTDKDQVPLTHGPNDIYARILPSLGGNRDYAYERNIEFITAQKSGTCSWQSLIKLIRFEVHDEKSYKKCIFDVRKTSLLAFYQKYSLKPDLSDQTVRLYERSKESFLQYALHLHKEGILTEKELQSIEILTPLELNSASTPIFPLSFDTSLPFPKKSVPQEYLRTPTPKASTGDVNLSVNQVAPLLAKTPPQDFSEFNSRLQQVNQLCKELQKTKKGHQILEIVTDFIHTLQAVSIEKMAEGQPGKEIESAMASLLYIHHLSMSAISMIPKEERASPDQFALLTVLFATNIKLSGCLDSSFNPFKKDEWEICSSKDFFLFETNQYATIHDPAVRTLFFENRSYLTQTHPRQLFGNFQLQPKGQKLSFVDKKCTGESLDFLLNDPAFRSRVITRFPELTTQSNTVILAKVLPELTDLRSDLFPKAYQILFLQNFFNNYSKNNPHLESWNGRSSIENESTRLTVFNISEEELSIEEFAPAGIENTKCNELDFYQTRLVDRRGKVIAPNNCQTYFKQYSSPFKTHQVDEIFEQLGGEENHESSITKKPPYSAPELTPRKLGIGNCYWTKTSNAAVSMPAVKGLSERETHEIGYIVSNKETRIANLLSYFHRYPNLFLERDFQLTFYHLLFSGSTLEETVKTNPLLCEKLNAFLESNARLQKDLGNNQAEIFLLSLMAELAEHLPPTGEKIHFQHAFDELASSIPDTRKRVKALAYMHFISSYSNNLELTQDEIIKLSVAYSYVRAFGYDKELSQRYIETKMHRAMNHVLRALPKVDGKTHLKIVEQIGETILQNNNMSWSGKYPQFSTANYPFRIELDTFSIFEGKSVIGALPDTIINHPHFQTLFSNKQMIVSCPQPGLYTFSPYRLFYTRTSAVGPQQLTIQKNIDGEWRTYFPPESVKNFLKPKCLIDNHACWAITKNNTTSLRIESLETESPIAEVLIKGNNAAPEWKKIHPGEKDDRAQLQDIYNRETPFSHFFHFQPSDSVCLWGDKTLEFPALGIQFTLNAEKKAIYSKDASYSLSETQTPPKTLPLFKACITLENKKEEKKYLFSREAIFNKTRGSLGRETEIKFENRDGRLFEIEEKKGKLVGKTIEENLYLLHLFIANKNYQQAHELLSQTLIGNPAGYTNDEKEIVQWIEKQFADNGDKSPEAYAILLQVSCFKIRNQMSSEQERKDWAQNISTDLMYYYSVKKHAKAFPLKSQQEIELLTFIKAHGSINSLLTYRLSQLEEGKENIPVFFEPSMSTPPIAKSIPQTLDIRSLAPLLSKKASSDPLFFLDGNFLLAHKAKDFFNKITSENESVRKSAALELNLLKITDPSLYDLRDLMEIFARKSTPEMRDNLQKAVDSTTHCQHWLDVLVKQNERIPRDDVHISLSEKIDVKTPIRQKKLPREDLHFSQSFTASLKEYFSVEAFFKKNNINLIEEPVKPLAVNPLLSTFAVKESDSKVLQAECLRLQNSIKKNDDDLASTKAYVLDDPQLEKMAVLLDTKIDDFDKESKQLEKEILSIANRRPLGKEEALYFELELQGKMKKELSLDDLIICYLQNNEKALSKRNPHLQQSDVTLLSQKLIDYLTNKTEIDHLTRVKNLALDAKRESGELKKPFLSDLNAALRQKREYEPTKEKVPLIFEYYCQLRLREGQKGLIDKMACADPLTRKNLIAQLIMGSGKSKVIAPLLAYLLSDGNNVPMHVVPKRLYHQNLEDARVTSGILHQPVETITLEQGKPLSIEKMKEIVNTMQRVREERSYLLVDDQTIHGLFLDFKEILYEIGTQAKTPELLERFHLLKKIINQFGPVLIDEVDLVLDCSKEVHISCGTPQRLDENTKNSLEKLFTAIHNDAELRDFFKLEHETEALFDLEKYNKVIKPRLVAIALDLTNIDTENRSQAEKYLLCDPSLTEVPSFIQKDGELRSHLAFSKELINKLFPVVLNNKNSNEHFGLSKETASLFAIPYLRSNVPSEGSEFGTPSETMLYTTLYYYRNGISSKNIKDLITICKNNALNEFRSFKTPLRETQGFKRFQELGFETDLFHIQEEEIQKAVELFNKDMSKKLAFSRHFGWELIGSYSQRLSSNAMSFIELFEWIQGFAGTLGNSDTFHKSLKPEPDLAIDGKTLNILQQSGSKVIPLESNSETLFKALNGYNAVIDEGAWFRGWKPIDVAKEVLVRYPSFKGVVYINDVDIPLGTLGRAVILEKGKSGEPPQLKLLSESHIPPEERFTYYNITEGIDIKQAPLARALTTISKTTTLRGMLQSVWRMRGLANQQKVDFALPKELVADIGGAELGDVFLHCTKNQASKQEEDNLRAVKQQISNQVERVIISALLNPDIENDEIIGLCEDVKDLIARSSSIDPWELFGAIELKKLTKEAIESYIATVLLEFKPIYDKNNALQKIVSWEKLESTISSLINYDLLPTSDFVSGNQGYNVQTQVKQETKTDKKIQTKTQINTLTEKVDLHKDAAPAEPWEDLEAHNLFSKDIWSNLDGVKTVNAQLLEKEKQLTGGEASLPQFSNRLKMTKNYMTMGIEDQIIFQNGTKPVGTAALLIDEKENVELYFLHPTECEFLSKLLSEDKKYDEKQVDAAIHSVNKEMANLWVDRLDARVTVWTGTKKVSLEVFLNERKIENFSTKEDLAQFFMKNGGKALVEFLSEEAKKMGGELNFQKRNGALALETTVIYSAREAKLLPKYNNQLSYWGIKNLLGTKREINVALMTPEFGVVKTGKTDINPKIFDSPQYIELVSQAKFYNGVYNDFTPKEQEYLTSWIKEQGSAKMAALFGNILRSRPDDIKAFEGSVLQKLFDEVA